LAVSHGRHEVTHSELGLPLIISVPADLKLYPGEIVDLTIRPPAPPLPPPTVSFTPAPTNPPPAATTNAPAPAATNAPPAKK
jgi:hypothetical protein